MHVLVLNVGSSSVKYSVYKDKTPLFGKNFENINSVEDRDEVIKTIFNTLEDKNIKIDAIGNRVVHGKNFTESCQLNKDKIEILDNCKDLAPLHNIPELQAIMLCKKYFKGVKQYGVFDTSFYTRMPEYAKMYGIPYKYYEKGIKRYGFHGTSHRFVSRKLKGKIITCHLGNGASITAIKDKKAIDTTMGFTPLEGLIMGTRCGNIDASVIKYISEKYNMSLENIFDMLNKKSGLLGISGISNDMRKLLKSKSRRGKLATEVFCYNAKKYIGSYAAVLNGVDTLVFTAGIGEGSWKIREKICKNMDYLGIKLDKEKNKNNEAIISGDDSKVRVMVIPTDEELMIVEDVLKLHKSKKTLKI